MSGSSSRRFTSTSARAVTRSPKKSGLGASDVEMATSPLGAGASSPPPPSIATSTSATTHAAARPPTAIRRRRLIARAFAPVAGARPTRGTRGRSGAGRSCRRRAGRDRRREARRAAARAAPSFATRRARASDREKRAVTTRPVPGSANGTVTDASSGKLCSQTGSCTITGTTSQRSDRACSQVSSRGGERKSDTTNTKLPDGRSARRRASWSSARSTLSSGASNSSSASRSSTSQRRRRPLGGSQNGAPSRRSLPA